MSLEWVRIVGPVLDESTSIGGGCYFVIRQDGRRDGPLGWFFPFLDSAPVDRIANWHVLAGFTTKAEAEAKRAQWLAHDGAHAIDDAATFYAVAELCRMERRRTYRRARRDGRRKEARSTVRRLRDGGEN